MHTLQALTKLATANVTDTDRAVAFETLKTVLVQIDVLKLDELRRRLELPGEAIGVMIELYAAILAGPEESRSVLPIASDGMIRPNVATALRTAVTTAFMAERFYISATGTAGGTADWLVNDLKFDGKTQLAQPGLIPGDVFGTDVVHSNLNFGAALRKTLDVTVTYVGANPEGARFVGSMIGREIV